MKTLFEELQVSRGGFDMAGAMKPKTLFISVTADGHVTVKGPQGAGGGFDMKMVKHIINMGWDFMQKHNPEERKTIITGA